MAVRGLDEKQAQIAEFAGVANWSGMERLSIFPTAAAKDLACGFT